MDAGPVQNCTGKAIRTPTLAHHLLIPYQVTAQRTNCTALRHQNVTAPLLTDAWLQPWIIHAGEKWLYLRDLSFAD